MKTFRSFNFEEFSFAPTLDDEQAAASERMLAMHDEVNEVLHGDSGLSHAESSRLLHRTLERRDQLLQELIALQARWRRRFDAALAYDETTPQVYVRAMGDQED